MIWTISGYSDISSLNSFVSFLFRMQHNQTVITNSCAATSKPSYCAFHFEYTRNQCFFFNLSEQHVNSNRICIFETVLKPKYLPSPPQCEYKGRYLWIHVGRKRKKSLEIV